MKGLSRKEKGLRDTNDSVGIAGGGVIKGLNGNGKNTIKIKFKKLYCPDWCGQWVGHPLINGKVLIRFPVRIHVYVVGWVPSWKLARG